MIGLDVIEGPTYRRANDDAEGWAHNFYVVRLWRGTMGIDYETLVTPWKQGTGIETDPSAEDVLASLMLDASSYENARNFEEWASDYGYATDSRKAYALYQTVGKQTNALRDFLRSDYDATSTEEAEDAAKRLVSA